VAKIIWTLNAIADLEDIAKYISRDYLRKWGRVLVFDKTRLKKIPPFAEDIGRQALCGSVAEP
jgi:hypothetical protein